MMKILNSDQVWKCLMVILAALIIVQLIFAPQVHDVTIYTYRIMRSYYVQSNSTNDNQFDQQSQSNEIPTTSRPVISNGTSKIPVRTTSDVVNRTVRELGPNDTCQPILRNTFVYIEQENSTINVTLGGEWRPDSCKPTASVAVIIPFRGRHDHLRIFLPYMHAFLQRQKLQYRIFVIEQYDDYTFNRAKLMNVGFKEASKIYSFHCYVFHDVDLLPLDERIGYNCSEKGPLHMASGIDKFGFNMPYAGYFGGVCAFKPAQLERINGFSNRYYGWGGEDDDISRRIGYSGQNAQRYPVHVARYHMLKHGHDKGNDVNPERGQLLEQTMVTWTRDGLNTLTYELVDIVSYPLYTNIRVLANGTQVP